MINPELSLETAVAGAVAEAAEADTLLVLATGTTPLVCTDSELFYALKFLTDYPCL